MFCLFVLRLNVPVNNFRSCRDGATASWVINQYFRGVKCLAQGHNTAAVGFEPPTSCSGVRHSTTEPPRSDSPASLSHFHQSIFAVRTISVGLNEACVILKTTVTILVKKKAMADNFLYFDFSLS